MLGFYHSAMQKTFGVSEKTDFWDLAQSCFKSVSESIKEGKHLKDMGDLNLLMKQVT